MIVDSTILVLFGSSPASVTARLLKWIFSLYVPRLTIIVSPSQEALIASWMLSKSSNPFGSTIIVSAAELETTSPTNKRIRPAQNVKVLLFIFISSNVEKHKKKDTAYLYEEQEDEEENIDEELMKKPKKFDELPADFKPKPLVEGVEDEVLIEGPEAATEVAALLKMEEEGKNVAEELAKAEEEARLKAEEEAQAKAEEEAKAKAEAEEKAKAEAEAETARKKAEEEELKKASAAQAAAEAQRRAADQDRLKKEKAAKLAKEQKQREQARKREAAQRREKELARKRAEQKRKKQQKAKAPAPKSVAKRPSKEEKLSLTERRNLAINQYKIGNRHVVAKKFNEAVVAYRKALEFNPALSQAHRGLGIAYASLGKSKDAVREYRLYLKMAPNAPDAAQVKKILGDAN